jgi:hypothetical protein
MTKRSSVLFLCCILACLAAQSAMGMPKSLTRRWVFIDKKGEIVIDGPGGRYSDSEDIFEAWTFAEGIAVVNVSFPGGLDWCFLNASGETLFHVGNRFDINNDYAFFSEGLVPFMDKSTTGHKRGYANTRGEIVLQAEYETASPFKEGLARIEKGDKEGFIDSDGEFAIPCKFEYAEPFAGGLAPIGVGKKHGYIDKSGEIAIAPTWDSGWGFS